MTKIYFGPTGLGPVKTAIETLEMLKSFGLSACEVAFTYGIYMKENDAREIGEAAKKLGIRLSIHAPYYINLNSDDESKVEKSKERILDCLKIGTLLDATCVVFHAGFYGKGMREEAYEKIKRELIELEKIRKEKNYTPKLAPETMGKINVFGSIEEISRLVTDTGCFACIDFAHVLSRSQGNYRFAETFELFKNLKEFHIHFSGIEYGEKGERNHIKTSDDEWRKLLDAIPKDKDVTIINESPRPVEDSISGLSLEL